MRFYAQLVDTAPSSRVPIDGLRPELGWAYAKNRVAEALDVPIDDCQFFHKGKILVDGLGSLASCRIQPDDVLVVRVQSIDDDAPQAIPSAPYPKTRQKLMPQETPPYEESGELVADYICADCKIKPRKKCKKCGCGACGRKDGNQGENIVCEECEDWFHWKCLDPPIHELPDDDWYCPHCKHDNSQIVLPDDIAQSRAPTSVVSRISSRINTTTKAPNKDTTRAPLSENKTCSTVPSSHRGPIPGIEVGQTWKSRALCAKHGVHRPIVAGIAGTTAYGAVSIVHNTGYEGDRDNGDTFIYTGSGGRVLEYRHGGSIAFDQKLDGANEILAQTCDAPLNPKGARAGNWRNSKGIRVIRGHGLKKKHPNYAPEEPYRYDGIYKMKRYYPEKCSTGFKVYKFEFCRDDPSPAPWTPAGARRIKSLGLKMSDDTTGPVSAWSSPSTSSQPNGLPRMSLAQEVHQPHRRLPNWTNKPFHFGNAVKTKSNSSRIAQSEASSSPVEDRSSKKRRTDGYTPGLTEDDFPRFCVVIPHKPELRGMILDRVSSESPAKDSRASSVLPIRETTSEPVHQQKRTSRLPPDYKKVIERAIRNYKDSQPPPQLNVLLNKPFVDRKSFIEEIEAEFECPICKDFIECPVTSLCGHVACSKCLEASVRSDFGAKCPLCRTSLVPGITSDDDRVMAKARKLWEDEVDHDRILIDLIRYFKPYYGMTLDF